MESNAKQDTHQDPKKWNIQAETVNHSNPNLVYFDDYYNSKLIINFLLVSLLSHPKTKESSTTFLSIFFTHNSNYQSSQFYHNQKQNRKKEPQC